MSRSQELQEAEALLGQNPSHLFLSTYVQILSGSPDQEEEEDL